MKIVIIGGTGLIGSKTVAILRQRGHEVVAASPESGVNTITGEGLKEALAGAQVVIDLENSPSFEDKAVLKFFETAGRNLLAAETAAGVRHHVALSIVGDDRSDNGYFRAKIAQEKLIRTSGIPYTGQQPDRASVKRRMGLDEMHSLTSFRRKGSANGHHHSTKIFYIGRTEAEQGRRGKDPADEHELGQHHTPRWTGARRVGSVALRAAGRRD